MAEWLALQFRTRGDPISIPAEGKSIFLRNQVNPQNISYRFELNQIFLN